MERIVNPFKGDVNGSDANGSDVNVVAEFCLFSHAPRYDSKIPRQLGWQAPARAQIRARPESAETDLRGALP